MECYVCGYALPEGANFCPNCGRNRAVAPDVPEITIPQDDALPVQEFLEPETPPAEHTEPALAEPVPTDAAEPEPPEVKSIVVEIPPKPKRRHPVLIPVLIMAGLFLAGLLCFWKFPYETTESPAATDPVIQDTPALTLPEHKTQKPQNNQRSKNFTSADEDCFEFTGGAVRFLPHKYDGGAVLVIPNEIKGKPVTAIADYGFVGLEGITTVILPDQLETIGNYAFADCEDLRGIYFPSWVSSIGERAFTDCISIESVSVPTSVKTIGAEAFDGCASLMYIFYSGTYEEWTALYNEYITPFTSVSCLDGDYYHGVFIR